MTTSRTHVPEILRSGAVDTARGLRAGELSSRELIAATLDRIAATNPAVNAIRVVYDEDALLAADAADRRLAAGTPCGPLDGVPITVKENVDVAGGATTQGVAAFAGVIADTDAPAVAHLRRAGAIVIARTNMPDFALRWHTDSGIAGPTLNPWDPTLTPGGSSGGEAVALATGMSMLGVGTDLGGSLRFPSQCAGTAALRPSLGRIPQATSIEPSAGPIGLQLLDVTGPMARRVSDLRLALQLMSAPDPRDPWHTPADPSDAPARPRRVHVLTDLGGVPIAPAVRTALDRAAAALAEHGYELRDEPPPGLHEVGGIWTGLLTSGARQIWPAVGPLIDPAARDFMDAMLDATPALDANGFGALFTDRQRLGRAWSEYAATTPLVLAPIFAGPLFAPGADLDGLEAAQGIVGSLTATLAANLLGLPSAAVPVGLVDGLPQAVQLIGPRFAETSCLDAAEVIEAACGTIVPITP